VTSSTPGVIVSSPPRPVVYDPAAALYAPAAALHARQMREVSMQDNYYSTSVLAVPAGTLVRWKNEGRHGHTVTFPGRWDSGPLAPGAEVSAYFPEPGRYYYYCRFHSFLMKGEIEVY
jgi:plastocyanin